jgi:hypothetical protein
MTEAATTVPAGNSPSSEPIRGADQSTGIISDAHYDGLASQADRDRFARVRRDDGNGSEWRDRSTLPSAQTADTLDPSKLPADSKHKFSHNGVEFELTGQQVADAVATHAADVARKATLPADPSGYKIELPADFKVPDGVELRLRPDLPEAQDLARWAHRHGVSPQAFQEILTIEATRQTRDALAITSARNKEIDRLGVTGTARIAAIESFLDSMGASGLKARIFTGRDVADFEKIISNRVSQGAAPMPRGGREPPEPQGRVSEEAYSKMSPGDRLSYARQHDQSSMPAWRDPRERPF